MKPTRQMLVAYGWSRLLREILTVALSNHGWRVIGSEIQASQAGESGDADLLLVYCSRPEVAIEDVLQARSQYRAAKIVLLGSGLTEVELMRLIEAGMSAYVDTHQGFPELLEAIQMVRENRSLSPGRITQLVLENISRLSQQHDARADAQLTVREKEVLYLITTGLGNKQIADSLFISPNTVKNHVHKLLQKLNVRSRHEAAGVLPCSRQVPGGSGVVRKATRA